MADIWLIWQNGVSLFCPKKKLRPRVCCYSIRRRRGKQNTTARCKRSPPESGDFFYAGIFFGRIISGEFGWEYRRVFAARLWHTPLRRGRRCARPCGRGLRLAVGLAGGWAVLYGALLPFGPGLTLGLAEDCFAASAAGAALGLLLHGFGDAEFAEHLPALRAGAAIVAGRWLWPGRFLPAGQAGCAALACSASLSLGGRAAALELLLFCRADALLAGPSALGCGASRPKTRAWAACCWLAAVAAALGRVWRLGFFLPGVMACAAAELALCCQGKGRWLRWPSVRPRGGALRVDPELAPAAAGGSCATGAAAAVLAPAPTGGGACGLCGRLCDRGALRSAARQRLFRPAQCGGRAWGGLPAPAMADWLVRRSPGDDDPRRRSGPALGGGHPAGSGGRKPLLAG